MMPKMRSDQVGKYDDFEYSTALAKMMMDQVISKFLADHKTTCQSFMLNERTREIIYRKVASKELNRVDFKLKSKKAAA